jgi:hypothetical protein
MPSPESLEENARECELMAEEACDERLAQEWRWMAETWREAAEDARAP